MGPFFPRSDLCSVVKSADLRRAEKSELQVCCQLSSVVNGLPKLCLSETSSFHLSS